MSNRAQRRRAAKLTGEDIFNPREKLRLKYDISLPGGPLRDENPVVLAGQIVADNEADLLRGITVKLIGSYGYERVGRAVVGLFCEMINPMSTTLRSMIAIGIAQGTGLKVSVQDITSCAHCGVEREVYEILDTTKDDEDALTEDDQTQHAEGCPTLPVAEGEDSLEPREWRTAPAIVVEQPQRYRALGTAPSAAAQNAALEAVDAAREITEEQANAPFTVEEEVVETTSDKS